VSAPTSTRRKQQHMAATAPGPATPAGKAKRERVFSGIQPSGTPTIGNYIGAIKYWVAEQDIYNNIYCVVDLHAITVPQDPAKLRESTRQLYATLIACGLDPERSAIFVQSHIHEHAELTWILNCITPMGWLNRMTQFKTKAGADREAANAGLYTYPVLMAADILLYHADGVPVGEDQKQHVELTRDIASAFNNRFGETFVEPRPIIRAVGARVMSLEDPTRKMSKSDGEGSYIALLDPPAVIRKKIARATTDSQRTIEFDEKRPGIFNLLTIYQSLTGESHEHIEAEFAGKGYKEFKAALGDAIVATLEPIQQRYAELMGDPAMLEALMAEGAAKIRPIAEATLHTVMEKVGLR
jgi:tryptophanyl-tRNA synthetase